MLFNETCSFLLMVFFVHALLCKVAAECSVDKSVPENEKKGVQDIIDVMKPFYSQKYSIQQDGMTYSLAICEDVTLSSSDGPCIIGLSNRTLGVRGDGWLQLEWLSNTPFSNSSHCRGRNQSTVLLVTCDSQISSLSVTLDHTSGDECLTHFSAANSVSCLSHPASGLSGFSVFIILLVVGFASYFILGFAYLRYCKSARGLDQIPHRFFWFRVGNTIADAVSAVCRCDRYCGGGGSYDDYMSVGGASAGASEAVRGAASGGYHSAYTEVLSSDSQQLLAPHRNTADADLLQP